MTEEMTSLSERQVKELCMESVDQAFIGVEQAFSQFPGEMISTESVLRVLRESRAGLRKVLIG